MGNIYNITVDESALKRIQTLRAEKAGGFGAKTFLRVAVEGGGCSGFQYKIAPDETLAPDDILIADSVAVDGVSAQYMKGAVIRFQNDMMSAMFTVDNPNATSSCGCSSSFSIDMSKI